jgi:hypothetical protein
VTSTVQYFNPYTERCVKRKGQKEFQVPSDKIKHTFVAYDVFKDAVSRCDNVASKRELVMKN